MQSNTAITPPYRHGVSPHAIQNHPQYYAYHVPYPQQQATTFGWDVRKISVIIILSLATFWSQVYYPSLPRYNLSTTSTASSVHQPSSPNKKAIKITHSISQIDAEGENFSEPKFLHRRESLNKNGDDILEFIRPIQSQNSITSTHDSTKETNTNIKIRLKNHNSNKNMNVMKTTSKINNSNENEASMVSSIFWGTGSYGGYMMKPFLFNKDSVKEDMYYGAKLAGNIQLPGYKQGWDPRLGIQGDSANSIPGDIPVFFNIPFSGSSIALDVMRSCHRLFTTMTGEKGIRSIPPESIQQLQIIYPGSNLQSYGFNPLGYANVDLSTLPGINRAKELGLASSGFNGVIVTPFIYQTDHIFYDTNARGRLFAIFRNPMERAAELFYYMKYATWEPTYDPELMNMSINQYAQSNVVENNWMTRKLANVPIDQELTQDHLQIALEVMRTRMIVGLYESLDESLDRFDRYFGWKFQINPNKQELCRQRFLSRGILNSDSNQQKPLEEGTEAFEQIFWQNQFDLEIYDYAKSLFAEQGQFVEGTNQNFRLG